MIATSKPRKLRRFAIVALGAIAAGSFPGIANRCGSAHAAEQAQVIEIKAKKYEFSPSEITLKKGEPVILRLTSEDRTHGFFIKPLKIDTDIKPGQATDITVTPDAAGEYVVICDHYCGTGHGNMKLKLTVVQ